MDITLLKHLLNRRWPIFSLTYRHRPSPSMTPSLRLSFPGRVCRSVPCRHRLPPRSACAQWLRSHTPRPQKKNGKSHFRNQQNLILRMSHKGFCDPNDSSLIFEMFYLLSFFCLISPIARSFSRHSWSSPVGLMVGTNVKPPSPPKQGFRIVQKCMVSIALEDRFHHVLCCKSHVYMTISI